MYIGCCIVGRRNQGCRSHETQVSVSLALFWSGFFRGVGCCSFALGGESGGGGGGAKVYSSFIGGFMHTGVGLYCTHGYLASREIHNQVAKAQAQLRGGESGAFFG